MTADVVPAIAEIGGNRYAIADHGAHVTQWMSEQFGDLLYLSSRAQFAATKAIRGGVPVCFPWFAAGPNGDLAPAHGVARTATWRRTRWDVDDESAVLDAAYELTNDDVAGAPGADRVTGEFTAQYGIRLSPREASLRLRVINDGNAPLSFEAALHTYLRVSDVGGVQVDGVDGAEYLDKTAGGLSRMQQGPVRFDGEVDRIYRSTADVQIADPAMGRVLTIAKAGSPQTVIWNPGAERAAEMADVGDGEWRTFVCVEAATVGDDVVTLRPGEHHDLVQSITLTEP